MSCSSRRHDHVSNLVCKKRNLSILCGICSDHVWPQGNSISTHPIFLELDIFTSQNFFIFAPFIGIIEIWELWKFQLLVVSEISLFKNLDKIPYGDQNLPFWIYVFFNNFRVKGSIKLKFGTGKFFGMRSPKLTLRIHKNKRVFSYFTF